MSIKIKDRIIGDTEVGYPCPTCLRMQRIRDIIIIGTRYVNKYFNRNDRRKYLDSIKDVLARSHKLSTDRCNIKNRNKEHFDVLYGRLENRYWREEKKRRLNLVPSFNRLKMLKQEFKELEKNHPYCVGCGIGFGGYHVSIPTEIPLGYVCNRCFMLYDYKWDRRKFRRKMEGRNTVNLG